MIKHNLSAGNSSIKCYPCIECNIKGDHNFLWMGLRKHEDIVSEESENLVEKRGHKVEWEQNVGNNSWESKMVGQDYIYIFKRLNYRRTLTNKQKTNRKQTNQPAHVSELQNGGQSSRWKGAKPYRHFIRVPVSSRSF